LAVAEAFVECVNDHAAETGYSLAVSERNPDAFSVTWGACEKGVSPEVCNDRLRSPVVLEANRNCRVEVPEFAAEHPVPAATFEFGLCLVDQGSRVMMDAWGYIGFLDRACPPSRTCTGFNRRPELPVDVAAWEVCRERVPDYVDPSEMTEPEAE
jgi:hypothetical protein